MSLKDAGGVNIVGAGLAGSLLAILLAKRGFKVTVYERRPDPRVVAAIGGRSINLALAARGIRGLKLAGVLERVMKFAIPMRGRMVHEHDGAAALQLYGVRPEEVIYSVSRAELNRVLIEAADAHPNVAFRFGQLCIGFAHGTNALEMRDEATGHIYHADAQPSIATDGAGSAVRDALVAREVASVREEPLDHDYKELDDSGGGWQTRAGGECAAHLAARRVHADRAAESRCHVHGDAVSGAARREQF